MVPVYWYYQNNHLLLIIRSTGVILTSLQLYVNKAQCVANIVDLSVVFGFFKFRNGFLLLYI
jgi:hypothetical protein